MQFSGHCTESVSVGLGLGVLGLPGVTRVRVRGTRVKGRVRVTVSRVGFIKLCDRAGARKICGKNYTPAAFGQNWRQISLALNGANMRFRPGRVQSE